MDLAIDLGRIAATPGTVADRAEALLQPLRRIVPFTAAWIGCYDASATRYEALVSRGYTDTVDRLFSSSAAVEQIDRLGLNRIRRPMRARDVPGALADRPIWAEYLTPAGFREGLTVGLFTGDGRHLGILTVNTDDAAHPSASAAALVGRLAPIIAGVIDPMRTVAAAAALVSAATAAVVLGRGGTLLPLPGLPAHSLLALGSVPLAVAAKHLSPPAEYARFLYPCIDSGARTYVRITVVPVPPQPFGDLTGVVVLSAAPDLHGLTHRELEILGLLIDGWSNDRIAAGLTVSPRTVAAHIEHILVKLHAPTRTSAAVRALREGTYLPWTAAAPVASHR